MRPVTKHYVLLLATLAIGLTCHAPGYAFTCSGGGMPAPVPEYPDKAYDKYAVVFVGKVLSETLQPLPKKRGKAYIFSILKVHVDTAYKGIEANASIEVKVYHSEFTYDSPRRFDQRQSYLFALHEKKPDGTLSLSACDFVRATKG